MIQFGSIKFLIEKAVARCDFASRRLTRSNRSKFTVLMMSYYVLFHEGDALSLNLKTFILKYNSLNFINLTYTKAAV